MHSRERFPIASVSAKFSVLVTQQFIDNCSIIARKMALGGMHVRITWFSFCSSPETIPLGVLYLAERTLVEANFIFSLKDRQLALCLLQKDLLVPRRIAVEVLKECILPKTKQIVQDVCPAAFGIESICLLTVKQEMEAAVENFSLHKGLVK